MRKELVQRFVKKLQGLDKAQQFNLLFAWIKNGDIPKSAIFKDIMHELETPLITEEPDVGAKKYLLIIEENRLREEEEQRKRDAKKNKSA